MYFPCCLAVLNCISPICAVSSSGTKGTKIPPSQSTLSTFPPQNTPLQDTEIIKVDRINSTNVSVSCRKMTYCVWGQGDKSPQTFSTLTPALLKDALKEKCLFFRKLVLPKVKEGVKEGVIKENEGRNDSIEKSEVEEGVEKLIENWLVLVLNLEDTSDSVSNDNLNAGNVNISKGVNGSGSGSESEVLKLSLTLFTQRSAALMTEIKECHVDRRKYNADKRKGFDRDGRSGGRNSRDRDGRDSRNSRDRDGRDSRNSRDRDRDGRDSRSSRGRDSRRRDGSVCRDRSCGTDRKRSRSAVEEHLNDSRRMQEDNSHSNSHENQHHDERHRSNHYSDDDNRARNNRSDNNNRAQNNRYNYEDNRYQNNRYNTNNNDNRGHYNRNNSKDNHDSYNRDSVNIDDIS